MAERTPVRWWLVTPVAGVVLAGGRSTRMGRDKATLPWAGTTLLGHVLAVLGAAVDGPLVVVGAADRPPPPIPAPPDPGPVDPGAADPGTTVRTPLVVADPVAGRGPLQGLATGLTAAAGAGAGRAFVASVDLPLLHREYVEAVLALLTDDVEVVLPVLHGHRQPLAAAYDTRLGARATALLAEGALRPGQLFAVSAVREPGAGDLLADPALRRRDPDLDAVRGANTPDELAVLRERS